MVFTPSEVAPQSVRGQADLFPRIFLIIGEAMESISPGWF
jgi:hypothetical protein